MKYEESKIKEIAEELDMGLFCYIHRQTGEVVSFPDPDDSFSEPELWQEEVDKVAQHEGDYLKLEPMHSTESFQVMADFAETLPEGQFREEVMERLSDRKPFRNFKDLVEDSEYRTAWFAFRDKAYEDWVRGLLSTHS